MRPASGASFCRDWSTRSPRGEASPEPSPLAQGEPQLWADPRKLERWWGPPTYPATVVEHDLRAGGKVAYLMTSPEGEQHHGWWKVLEVDEAPPPRR